MTLRFRLHAVRSLKGKRQIASSLKQKLRNRFNVSVSEICAQDSHDRLVLGVVTVSNDTRHAQSTLSKALDFVQSSTSEELMDTSVEIFSADDPSDTL
nr:DUF503 domain-containing protein [Desulfobaculum xiamenense]